MMIDQADWLMDPALVLPAYTYVDAGHYAGIPAQTIRNWYKGSSRPGHTMQPVMDPRAARGLSYLQLGEVAFVAAMRHNGLKLSTIRDAYRHVRDALGIDYPFLRDDLHSDGVSIFVEALSQSHVTNVSRGGQLGWREAFDEYFADFDFIDHLALRWFPHGRPAHVVIDPRISFGSPVVEGTGIPTYAVFARHRVGETMGDLEADFRLTRPQLDAALTFERRLRHAA